MSADTATIAQAPCHKHSHRWLDSLAIGMAMICAVHCLVTPLLVAVLPIIATTFWVSSNFHLWMLLFVLPTTGTAVFLGCRKHKDKIVLGLGLGGLALLTGTTIYEMMTHVEPHCEHCATAQADIALTPTVSFNVLAGLLLASAHIRNFLLCRSSKCDHSDAPKDVEAAIDDTRVNVAEADSADDKRGCC